MANTLALVTAGLVCAAGECNELLARLAEPPDVTAGGRHLAAFSV